MAYTRKDCIPSDYIYIGFELPCDVRLPPNTVIRAGCKLETLIAAMELSGRPHHFDEGVTYERGFGPGDGDSRIASVDTHPEGGDVKQAPSSMGSAVAATGGETPNTQRGS
jgi:hypothetical protein